MSAVGLESIEHTVQLTHVWINELDELLGWRNKHRSYRLLRSVLQAVRDLLPTNETADFAAQLPTLLRGVYYEKWRPATTPSSSAIGPPSWPGSTMRSSATRSSTHRKPFRSPSSFCHAS